MGDEEKKDKIELPDGIKPMFIQASSLEKYNMKTGESISDTVPFKEFNVAEVLEECITLGFMSDFHAFMKDIAQYQVANGGSDNSELTILVVRDEEEKYGDNFYICLTTEAMNLELDRVKKLEAEKQAAIAAKEAEEAARAAAEYARLNAVFVDEPMYARPYKSVFEEDSVLNNVGAGDRPLMLCRVSRPRSSFGGKCPQFGPRDCDSDNKQVELRPLKNPDFDTQLSVRDIGLQAPNTTSSTASTQTPWYRPVNKGSQFNGFDADASIPLIARKFKGSLSASIVNSNIAASLRSLQKGSGVEMHSIGVGGSPLDEEEETKAREEAIKLEEEVGKLATFLKSARGSMEEALQQNETVEIFGDAFAHVGGEESGVGQKGDNDLKELRSFNDIKYSKNMSLSCIDWHPSRRTMLAVSPVRNMTFYDRNASAGRPCPAHVLLWDFADLIHPQIMLEGPHEMLCFRFNRNPDQHDLIVCGCVNGQVIIFDVKKAMSKLNERESSKGSNKSNGMRARRDTDQDKSYGVVASSTSTADITATVAEIKPREGEPAGIEPVTPYAVSALEYSHRKSVFDIHWLAPDAQIDWRGNLLDAEHLDGKSYQFITASGDGQCLVWDIRFAAIAAGDYPHILKVRTQGDKRKLPEGELPPWLPLFRMELKRPGGAGDLLPARLTLLKQGHGVGAGTGGGLSLPGDSDEEGLDKKTDRRSMFVFGADSGEFAFGDWRPSGSKVAAQSKSAKEDEEGTGPDTPNYVSWVSHDHVRPAVSLDPSPFFPSLILSVSDRFFTLWVLGREKPCFHSSPSSVFLTCGRWSQTRPGVLYMGRQDGTVDIWDLTDSSHKPSATVTVSSTRVTFMEFCNDAISARTSSVRKSELLACGDAGGNLHVLEMPRNLCRATPHERSLMEAFIYREVKRVDYEGEMGTDLASLDESAVDAVGGNEDASPRPPPPAPSSGDQEEDPVQTELAKAEAAYRAMEAQYIAELGLQEEELPDHWKKAQALKAQALPPPPESQ